MMITNARVKNWSIQKAADYNGASLEICITLELTSGMVCLHAPISELNKIFDIFEIANINNLTNKPCIALVTDNTLRTIGNFLWWDKRKIYEHNKDEAYMANAEDWLDYDKFLKYENEEK